MIKFNIVKDLVLKIVSKLERDDYNKDIHNIINEMLDEISILYEVPKHDVLRYFEEIMGYDPVTWYYNSYGDGNRDILKIEKKEIKETSSGNVASFAGGFNPEDVWRSIYPVKYYKNKQLKQKIIKRK